MEPHPRVTFGLIRRLQRDHPRDADLYFPPLILTATNLSTGRLTLIKSYDERFGDVPIARAVRASAGFPFFFRPVEMAFLDEEGREVEGRFVDGGVISNFPAWVFSSVLRSELDRYVEFADIARQPWLNIGLRLVADPARGQPPARGPRAGLLKAMFGLLAGQVRDELETSLADRVPRLLPIRQLDTDTSGPGRWNDVHLMSDDKIRAMFARGLDAADDLLKPYSFALPPANDPAIRRAMAGLVERATRVFGHADNAELRLRVTVFIPRRGEHGRELVLRYALKYGEGRRPPASLRLRYRPDRQLLPRPQPLDLQPGEAPRGRRRRPGGAVVRDDGRAAQGRRPRPDLAGLRADLRPPGLPAAGPQTPRRAGAVEEIPGRHPPEPDRRGGLRRPGAGRQPPLRPARPRPGHEGKLDRPPDRGHNIRRCRWRPWKRVSSSPKPLPVAASRKK